VIFHGFGFYIVSSLEIFLLTPLQKI